MKWFSLEHSRPFEIELYSVITERFRWVTIDEGSLKDLDLKSNSFIYQEFSHA